MIAWGINCSEWDDAVDWANLELFDFGDIPVDQDIVTTWHDDQPLNEVFSFAKNDAKHPYAEINETVLIHIGSKDRHAELLAAFQFAD